MEGYLARSWASYATIYMSLYILTLLFNLIFIEKSVWFGIREGSYLKKSYILREKAVD